MKCGLLGRKLGHSYSPQIHAMLGSYSYELFEKEPEELKRFLRSGDFDGINVTVPYKKDVLPFLDELDERARKLGSVNTIVRRPDGTLAGHNTDFYGFEAMVKQTAIHVRGKKALVLGSGGASVTVSAVLREQGAEVVVISRKGENNYTNLYRHQDARLIVNTTPVGMYPNTGASPLALESFPRLEAVLDLIYNPARTRLLLDAEKLGIPTQNGLLMLVAQAKQSAEFFTGSVMDDGIIRRIHAALRRQMENIVLIGMPGCGKSTIGAALAKATGKTFVDADEEIVKLAGKTIPEIFAQDSETAFREYETQVLARLGKGSGLVIATGGGCVKQARNYPLLHQNGRIFWLQRELAELPTDGRPLSQSTPLTELYQQREPLYRAFADARIDNNGSVDSALGKIVSKLEETQ